MSSLPHEESGITGSATVVGPDDAVVDVVRLSENSSREGLSAPTLPASLQADHLMMSANVTPFPIATPSPERSKPESEVRLALGRYHTIKEGQLEPSLGKIVDTLIARGDTYAVYLDDELYVEWICEEFPPGAPEIMNRISWLEAKPIDMLQQTQQRTFRRMLGEGAARALSGNLDEANDILDKAEAWITARSQEVARQWLLRGSAILALPLTVAAAILWFNRAPFIARWGPGEVDLLMATLLGSLGAHLSIIWNTRKAPCVPEAGRTVHYLESFARVVAGMSGALIISLAVRADWMGGVLRTGAHASTFLLAIVAGISERLVPSFVENVESSLSRAGTSSVDRTAAT